MVTRVAASCTVGRAGPPQGDPVALPDASAALLLAPRVANSCLAGIGFAQAAENCLVAARAYLDQLAVLVGRPGSLRSLPVRRPLQWSRPRCSCDYTCGHGVRWSLDAGEAWERGL